MLHGHHSALPPIHTTHCQPPIQLTARRPYTQLTARRPYNSLPPPARPSSADSAALCLGRGGPASSCVHQETGRTKTFSDSAEFPYNFIEKVWKPSISPWCICSSATDAWELNSSVYNATFSRRLASQLNLRWFGQEFRETSSDHDPPRWRSLALH